MINPEEEAFESFNSALKLVELEYKNVPDGSELVERVTLRLKNAFDNPPIEGMETILQQRLSYDQARIALFRPLEEQIKYYPLILHGTVSVPSDHPLEKLRALIISLIYLSHRKSWLFLEEFIIAGGLTSLVPLLVDKNLYLRGQIMEILMNITDCDTFDWFQAIENKKSRNYILHVRLLQLAEHPDFLKNLLANRINSYPGGSFRALQMMAFWMSWVRALYTENQELQLSKRVLDELYLWGSIAAEDTSEEEMKLAQTVYDDFSSQLNEKRIASDISVESTEPLYVSGFSYQVPCTDSTKENENLKANPEIISKVEVNVERSVLDIVKDLKEKANELYKEHKYEESLEVYAEALDLLHDCESNDDTSSLEVTLHFNRAASLWMISKELREGKVSSENHDDEDPSDALDGDSPGIFELLRCEQACKAALTIHKSHVKSVYRLANVLLLLGKFEEALQIIEEVLAVLANNNQKFTVLDNVEVTDIDGTNDQIKILKKMKTKCQAALIVRNDNAKVESIIGSRTAKILNQLQSRNKRENEGIQHAWGGKWIPPEENEKINNENNIENNDLAISNSNINDIYYDMIQNDNNEKKQKKVEKKPKKASDGIATKSTKVNKKLMENFNKLKKLAVAFDSGKNTEANKKDARILLQDIWDQSLTLNEVIDCSLEETLLIFIFNLVNDETEDSNFSFSLLNQIMDCQRVETQTRLALHGNDTLKLLVHNILMKMPNDKLRSLII